MPSELFGISPNAERRDDEFGTLRKLEHGLRHLEADSATIIKLKFASHPVIATNRERIHPNVRVAISIPPFRKSRLKFQVATNEKRNDTLSSAKPPASWATAPTLPSLSNISTTIVSPSLLRGILSSVF
ncbi:hypothetical protein HJC23_011858 [Cyclotella cryptica]|uniref:Uncharacterized protein n=1 Tax=Cyclotella cryptica TaxID=29204 RepID=A0ABD3QF51_9STRA